jgi:hypothetical protein
VDNIDVSYAPEQPNQITIQATDFWALLTNRRFFYEPSVYAVDDKIVPSMGLFAAVEQVGDTGFIIGYDAGTSPVPEWGMTIGPQANVTFGSIAANCLTSGLGFIWINPNTGDLNYRPRSNSGTPDWTIGNNHGETGHLCMADLDTVTRSDDVYNNVLLTQKYEHLGSPVFEALYVDQDSIDLYGERSEDFTVDLADLDDAVAWSAAVFATKPVTTVQSVVTPAIDRDRALTEAVEFMPGDYVGVKYETNDIAIDTSYTVTRVRHSIDVNNWFTTLDVWKEF